MRPEKRSQLRSIRQVIEQHGYKNLLLTPGISLDAAGRAFDLRRKVIQQVIQRTGRDYAGVYAQLIMILRDYEKALKAGDASQHNLRLYLCPLCGKPVFAHAVNKVVFCRYHRRYKHAPEYARYRREIGKGGARLRRRIMVDHLEDLPQIKAGIQQMLDAAALEHLLALRKSDPAAYLQEVRSYAARLQEQFDLQRSLAEWMVVDFFDRWEIGKWKQLTLF